MRYEQIETVKLGKTRTKTTKKADVGLERDQQTDELIKEMRNEPVATFRLNPNGARTLRLGGVHGKLWGALRQSGRLLVELGDADFKSFASVDRIMQLVQISPMYPDLSGVSGVSVEAIPQIMAGGSRTMVVQRFDVIGSCEVTMAIQYPAYMKRHVEKLIQQLESMALFNKRRGELRVLALMNVEELSQLGADSA